MFTKVNGKDVLWSPSALKINNSEKLFQASKAALEDRVNELHRNLKELMGPMLSDSSHCFVPLELYFTRKIS